MPDNILTPVGNLRGQLTSGGLIPGVPIVVGEASGNPAHFTDGTNNPLYDCILDFVTTQEGSGVPSPSNPRPFNSLSSATVNVSGSADPSEGIDYLINWNLPRYNFYVDVNNMQLHNRWYFLDLGSVNWNRSAAAGYTDRYNTSAIADKVYRSSSPTTLDLMCPIFAPSIDPVYDRIQDSKMCILSSNGMLYISQNGYNTAAEFKAAMSGVILIYRLANEIVEDYLSQNIILSKTGENYISSTDVNNLSVKYVIDMQNFLQWVYDNLYTP